MLKKLLFLIVFFGFFQLTTINAQTMSGFGVEVGTPVGKLQTNAKVGVGLGVEFRIFPFESIAFGMHASWQYYFGGGKSFSMISLRAKAEYFFTDQGAFIRPFAGLEPGLYISSFTGPAKINFGGSPIAGILFAMSDYANITLNARYNFIFSSRTVMVAGFGVSLIYTIHSNKRR